MTNTFTVYSRPANSSFTVAATAADAIDAFHAARNIFRNTGQSAVVVDSSDARFDIFQISDRREYVSPRYADEWKRENFTNCNGTGIVSDGQEQYHCRYCA